MSADEQVPSTVQTAVVEAGAEQERSEKILKAKELYSHGSRNFLVKSYAEAADELSQVCALYEELYGELSDEIGMPYLLYAKSLIALALDENKVIDVPDEEDDDDDDDADDADVDDAVGNEVGGEAKPSASSSAASAANGKLASIAEKSTNEVDSTNESSDAVANKSVSTTAKPTEEAQVSSTNDAAVAEEEKPAASSSSSKAAAVVSAPVIDGEKPSTSNGADAENADDEDDENEAASSLQLAWEILELAAKIFSRQGASGLPNLAEVQTELANIEFENNILDSARDDYEKALQIYQELPTNYRRAMAEIHYKIGLTFLMQQLNKEGAESLKAACKLIESEIEEINKAPELSDKDKNNIQDMEETKQEIWAKIAEIEETQAQNIAEVRAALDSYIKPISSEKANGSAKSHTVGAAASSSSASEPPLVATISSSSKPTDITHLIKRKKADDAGSEAEAAASPAKRPAL